MATISQTNQGLLSVREELTQEDANKSFDFSPILAELRYTFESGKTKDLDFRRTQLQALIDMVAENTDRITEAIRADLGGPKFRGVPEIWMIGQQTRLWHILLKTSLVNQWYEKILKVLFY